MSVIDKLQMNVGRVLVSFESEEKSKGGIVLVTSAQGQGVQTATIEAAGDVRVLDGGQLAALPLFQGDKVLADRLNSIAKIKLDDKELWIFRHEDVFAKIKEDSGSTQNDTYMCQKDIP